jgi:tyrosyl-tRNA synthetase
MNSAEQISYALFYGKVAELSSDQLLQALDDVPTYDLHGVDSIGLVDLLTEAQVVASKRRAREDIKNGAITVNDVRLKDVNKTLESADRVAGNFIVIRRGKNKYFLVRWQT